MVHSTSMEDETCRTIRKVSPWASTRIPCVEGGLASLLFQRYNSLVGSSQRTMEYASLNIYAFEGCSHTVKMPPPPTRLGSKGSRSAAKSKHNWMYWKLAESHFAYLVSIYTYHNGRDEIPLILSSVVPLENITTDLSGNCWSNVSPNNSLLIP